MEREEAMRRSAAGDTMKSSPSGSKPAAMYSPSRASVLRPGGSRKDATSPPSAAMRAVRASGGRTELKSVLVFPVISPSLFR